MELSYKRQRFVQEYLIDLNATQAAIRTGYSRRTANEQGARLLAIASIKEAIVAGQRKLANKLEIKAESILAEIANLAFSDIGDILDFTGEWLKLRPPEEITAQARRCISSIKLRRYIERRGDDAREVEVIELRFWDKGSKLHDLAKHLGLFAEKRQQTGSGGKAIPDECKVMLDLDGAQCDGRILGLLSPPPESANMPLPLSLVHAKKT